jgi:hypothetical protein
MNRASSYSREPREKEQDRPPFFQLGNEILDLFQPIMGAHCFTIYSHLVRRVFKNPLLKHTVRDLAKAAKQGTTTVSRSLEVMAHMGLVKLVRRGGSQQSECKLLDAWKAAKRFGAVYERKTLSCSFPHEAMLRLENDVKEIRARQQGKKGQSVSYGALRACGEPSVRVSQRNTGVSPEKHQRTTRETQTGTHLLGEEVRSKESPTPTPTPEVHCKAEEDKDSPDEDEPDELLKCARRIFTGVMNELEDDLFNASRPPARHLANGFADWQQFGFRSLAVEAAAWHGEVLMLVLSASDPAAARRGLERYRKQWKVALRKWYECEVDVNVQETSVKR